MRTPDWRCCEGYDELNTSDVATLAWEFLRRNPEFRADYHRVINGSEQNVEMRDQQGALVERWGIVYRSRPQSRRLLRHRTLDRRCAADGDPAYLRAA